MSFRIVSSRFPYLLIHIEIRRGSHDVEALIDTGFDGGVALPPEMIMNGEPPDGYQRWKLANGSTVLAPFYRGTVQIGKFLPFRMLVVAMGQGPVIGRGVTDRFTVIFKKGKQVILEL